MFRNYFLLNLLLILIISFLGTWLYKVLAAPIEIPTKPSIESLRKYKIKPVAKLSRADSSSYDVILSKNLFHPSRSINEKPAEISTPVSKDELPQLFGTIIMEENKLAILEDQSTKKSQVYKVNDSIAGFTVYKIMENKVLLQKGDESIEVSLRSDKKFKPAQKRQPAIRKTTKPRKRSTRVRRNTSRTRRPPARRPRRR